MKTDPTEYEDVLYWQIGLAGLVPPERQARFHRQRRWRVDFLWPRETLAVEVEGGVWSGGRHTRPSGYVADLEKYNELALSGYCLLRVTTQQVASGAALALVERALALRGAKQDEGVA